jgi:hypothetical protein
MKSGGSPTTSVSQCRRKKKKGIMRKKKTYQHPYSSE